MSQNEPFRFKYIRYKKKEKEIIIKNIMYVMGRVKKPVIGFFDEFFDCCTGYREMLHEVLNARMHFPYRKNTVLVEKKKKIKTNEL